MSQKIAPFIETKYGWDLGEGGWNTGMDENLLKFSFLFNRNINSIEDTLPPASNGNSHFLTTDRRLYFAVGTTWYSTPTPKWFQVRLKDTGDVYEFDGSSLVPIEQTSELADEILEVSQVISNLGSAAFQDSAYFATQAALDVSQAEAGQYVDSFREQLSSPTGADLVGYRNRSQGSKNRDSLSTKDIISEPTDGTVNNSTSFSQAIEEAQVSNKNLDVIAGNYAISGVSSTGTSKLSIKGESKQVSKISRAAGATGNMLTLQNKVGLDISDTSFEKIPASSTDNGHALVLIDQSNSRVNNITIDRFGGIGTGIISYTTGGEDYSGNTSNITYSDITVKGDRTLSSNTNGVLITNSDYSRMSGIYTEGIAAYAVEYKSLVRWSLASDIIVNNANVGYGYGQTTTNPSLGVSFSSANNLILKGCDVGVLYGKGGYNNLSNLLVDSTGAESLTPRAVRTTLNSTGNAFNGVLLVGNYGEAVRWDSNANFGSFYAHNTGSSLLTIGSGSERNVTEISHPGSRSTIRDSINDSSGQALSGISANPVYCLATGEFLGTFAGRWRFTHSKVDGVSPSSAMRHVVEANGAANYAIISDGTAGCGLSVAFPSVTANASYSPSGYWQLAGGAWNARFSADYWRPSTDNVVALGGASNRFTTVYAGTGTINTSDERSKQQIKPIDEAALRAWARVEYVQYKFNDAVEEKGGGARWHFGLIAQRVKEAFEAEGLDAFDYGLLCYDEWDETPAVEEQRDDDGNVVVEAEPYRAGGNRYGIRYEEALALECAYLRSLMGK